jgi:hypothetical protein
MPVKHGLFIFQLAILRAYGRKEFTSAGKLPYPVISHVNRKQFVFTNRGWLDNGWVGR